MTHWGDITARARELADRERRLYDQRTIPAVLEQLAAELEASRAEAARLRAEAEKSAAQRDEAVLRAELAEEAKRAVEADLAAWRDVVCWTDDDEKTLIDWFTGGGDPDGEFSRLGLRREFPDGRVLRRQYRAVTDWEDLGGSGRAPVARIRSDRQKGEAL